MNEANMKVMQTQINMVKNKLRNKMKNSIQTSMSNQTNEIKNMIASLFKIKTASTSGSGSLPSNTVANPKGDLKAITTRSGIVLDGPTVPTPPPFIYPEEDERVKETLTDPNLSEYTIKVPPPPVQKYKPPSQREYVVHQRDPLHSNILYPSRMLKQKQQEKDEYQKMLKALLSNKEKLQELANTPLNESFSTVILKKLPEKLGDPKKFLISCGFSELKCKALADLGASINLIPLSVWKKLVEDFLEDLFSNQPSGNPTFSSHLEITSPKVQNDIFEPEGGNVLPKKLLDLDSTKDLHPPLHFDVESDLKEIEFLLYQDVDSSLKDSIDQSNPADNFVDSIPEMFTDEHAPGYSSPSIFDEYDDDFLEVESDTENDFSKVDAKPSTNNEDKVFNPGILSQENPFEIITRVVQDKKLAISNASLVLEDFDPPFYEPLFFKEVPKSKMLLSFSSENEEKVFKPGIHNSEKVHSFQKPNWTERTKQEMEGQDDFGTRLREMNGFDEDSELLTKQAQVAHIYKDHLCACPHHGFTELHQLDTFYNALNPANQDSLNAAACGNLLERRTQDVLMIFENKSKIAKLTHAVNQQTSVVTTAMTAILKQFQVTPPPASMKAVKETCVACGGAHPYYQCLAAGGNTFLELRDNIQGYISAVAVNYNQGNSVYHPPGSGSLPSNTVTNLKGELKAITTRSGIVLDGPTGPTPPSFINLEEDEHVEESLTNPDLSEYTIKVPPPPVQKYKPPSQREYVMQQRDPLHPNIPYTSRMLKQKQSEKKKSKSTNFSKSVILKKLPEKLRDPGKFLLPCGFSELKCKALADLGASINLMPLFVWKKLGLPELISTRMTVELTNRAICTPAEIARDIFVQVGKFTFPADFVIVDYESDPRVPLILGRPFLRTARALINVHGEEMILRDGDERLTLNIRHDTSSYSNQPQKESINLINVFNNSSEDFLEDLFSNQPSANPTFSSHPEITSPEVQNDIFDPEGGNVLPKKLLDLVSNKYLYPPLHVNPLSGSTTYSSSPNPLLEELADELALITFPPKYDDDLYNHADHFVDSMPEMFTNEHAPDYSSPSIFNEYDDDFLEVESDIENVYDDPFDSNGEKIKESKLLIDELDLPCDFLPLSEYDSFISQDFSRVDAKPSTNNEDKVFNPGILSQENPFEIITRVVQDKKLAISNASLVREDFDPLFYEPLFFKEVPSIPRNLKTNTEGFCPPVFISSASLGNHGRDTIKKDKIQAKLDKTEHETESVEKSTVRSRQKVKPDKVEAKETKKSRKIKKRDQNYHFPKRAKKPFILEESPIDTMADQRTMAELLRAPTEGYAEAIVVPPILAEQFKLKHSLINMMTTGQFFRLEKDNPHDHIPDQDSLNAAAGGNLLERRTQDMLRIIENKSKQTSDVTTVMTAILKQFQATPPPASVKAVEEICVTCGGAHTYYQCLAAGGNSFPELRDNIQGYVSAAVVNYNQGNFVYRPPENASNKEKLQELANTPLNENCSTVILKKLPEKLGDPVKFLIPCGFSELKCKALADLVSLGLRPEEALVLLWIY
uniref:Reverse transcriptase domain-containing protein n=1 Tax=Tanacetum cinerariifolium TaxID=118510 RepID=A0A6L2LWH3_TANCI|nr:hypothetical protein [Tanacetum cinerariifolium]